MSIEEGLIFSDEEAAKLFEIARKSILTKMQEADEYSPDENSIPKKLKTPLGAFVTLKLNGNLRGCIGMFISRDPLYEVVKRAAACSAFEDPRFDPLSWDEFCEMTIEITVLGPLKKVKNISEIVLGKHGIYIKKEFKSGTMLPQVPVEHNWTIEEFLGYTSREKVGIGWEGWKTADIYKYDGLVLKEKVE
jgi:AmmeMemoRadiSam system protein A